MDNLNQSNTQKAEKDYWRTPNNLINDALGLLNTWRFGVDVCAKDADTSIALATTYIDESIDALSPLVELDENYIVKNERYHCQHLPMFCNPPFSKKWEFFQKAIEQYKSSGHKILMVLPYTPATRA